MIKRKEKRGQIVVENVIFIILDLLFLSMLLLFVYSKSGSEAKLEEKYAKQIALIIDAAKPETTVYLNMEDAISKAEENKMNPNQIISVSENAVTVKLRENGGSTYYFFNDVNATIYSEFLNDPQNYVIKIREKER